MTSTDPPPPHRPDRAHRGSSGGRDRLLRRAWGMYFGTWAAADLALLAVGAVALGGSPLYTAVAFLGISLLAGGWTLRQFQRAWESTHFPVWRVGLGFIVSFGLLSASLVLAALAPSSWGFPLVGLAFDAVAAILLLQLRWCFPSVPLEGRIAVIALVLVGSATAVLGLASPSILVFGGLWFLLALAWGACAAWAWSSDLPEDLPAPTPGVLA